jgi:hypothetical protein
MKKTPLSMPPPCLPTSRHPQRRQASSSACLKTPTMMNIGTCEFTTSGRSRLAWVSLQSGTNTQFALSAISWTTTFNKLRSYSPRLTVLTATSQLACTMGTVANVNQVWASNPALDLLSFILSEEPGSVSSISRQLMILPL